MDVKRKGIPITVIKEHYTKWISLGKNKDDDAKLSALEEFFDYELDIIQKYLKQDGEEITDENLSKYKDELRDRVLNAVQGSKFR